MNKQQYSNDIMWYGDSNNTLYLEVFGQVDEYYIEEE